MAEQTLEMRISAHADGELDAASAAALAAELSRNPQLARELAICNALDAAARAIPVPVMDEKLAGRWAVVRERIDLAADPVVRRLETAAEIPVPHVSEARFDAVWKNIQARTVELSARDLAEWAKLDAAAARIPVPQLDANAFEFTWSGVDARTQEAPAGSVPPVNDQRWENVWRGIQSRTTAKAAPPALPAQGGGPLHDAVRPEFSVVQTSEVQRTVVRVDFAPRRRKWMRWAATAGLAAALLFSVLKWPGSHTIEMPPLNAVALAAVEVPEVLDERYHVQVKYLEGQPQPVLCFFLNDHSDDSEDGNWHWLPD
jgi:anti-sigma factor RsiW